MSKNVYLPIGSVVLLHNATKRLMIIGVDVKNMGDGKDYDYYAVLYPEGFVDEDHFYFFNNRDIARVFFTGFDDDERREFLDALQEYQEEGTSNA